MSAAGPKSNKIPQELPLYWQQKQITALTQIIPQMQPAQIQNKIYCLLLHRITKYNTRVQLDAVLSVKRQEITKKQCTIN